MFQHVLLHVEALLEQLNIKPCPPRWSRVHMVQRLLDGGVQVKADNQYGNNDYPRVGRIQGNNYGKYWHMLVCMCAINI